MAAREGKRSSLIPLLAILSIIVLVGGTGFGVWYWQQQEIKKQKTDSDKKIAELRKKNSLSKSQTNTKSTEIIITDKVDSKSGQKWLRYIDYINGYSIEFPYGFKATTVDDRINDYGILYFGFNPTNYDKCQYLNAPMIGIGVETSKLSAEDYAKSPDRTGVVTVTDGKKFTTQDGLAGYEETSQHMSVVSRIIHFSNGEKVYSLKLSVSKDMNDVDQQKAYDNSSYLSTFKEMASTFKFTR